MRLHLTLAVLAALAVSAWCAKSSCRSNRGENLIQFNGRNQDIHLPCGYPALRGQKCGKWTISLSPGNRWVHPKYQLDTLWLELTDDVTGDYWEGRTTNKLAVKYWNAQGDRPLWNKKGGSLDTDAVLDFGSETENGERSMYARAKDGAFQIAFIPWDPNNRKEFTDSDWTFTCFHDEGDLDRDYPRQMCGGDVKKEVEEQAKERFGLAKRFRANLLYFDIFTDTTIEHPNPKCTEATAVLTESCSSDEQRMTAINNCQIILHGVSQAKCITSYSCDPMDVFNACLRWGCADFARQETDLCYAVAEGIDMCPECAHGGNLTARVQQANCNKDFLTIEV